MLCKLSVRVSCLCVQAVGACEPELCWQGTRARPLRPPAPSRLSPVFATLREVREQKALSRAARQGPRALPQRKAPHCLP